MLGFFVVSRAARARTKQGGGTPGRQGTIGTAPDRQEQGGRADRGRNAPGPDRERNAPGRNIQERGNSVGVANVRRFVAGMEAAPKYVTDAASGAGFAELAAHLLGRA